MFIIRLFIRIFCNVFAKQIRQRELIKREEKEFLEKFPCPHCRPDGCTFYWDTPCYCNECGRKYSI